MMVRRRQLLSLPTLMSDGGAEAMVSGERCKI